MKDSIDLRPAEKPGEFLPGFPHDLRGLPRHFVLGATGIGSDPAHDLVDLAVDSPNVTKIF